MLEDYEKLTDLELIRRTWGSPITPLTVSVDRLLQLRSGEREAKASEKMAASTDKLADFTRAMARATWALFFVGGATLLLTLVQVLKALGVLQ